VLQQHKLLFIALFCALLDSVFFFSPKVLYRRLTSGQLKGCERPPNPSATLSACWTRSELKVDFDMSIKEITNNFEVKNTVIEKQLSVALVPRQHSVLHFKQLIFFDVLLTVHLSIFISVINQLDAQNLFRNKFYFMPLHVSITCPHHQEVKIALHSLWYHHTYRWPS